MYANFGPGIEAVIDPPSPGGIDLFYTHQFIANRFGRIARQLDPNPSPCKSLFLC